MLLIDDLVAGRGETPVARLRSLEIGAGEAALLTGASGAGKTTLLLAMAGLARSFGGRAVVAGEDVAAMTEARRDAFRGRNIGLVFQDIHLIPGLTALQNLLAAPFAAGAVQDKARALSLLEELGLGDKANRPAQKLSRGEAQRAAIARAMLLRPKVILADEPTASLDDEAFEAVAELLLRAGRETGAALLIATHDRRLKERIPRHAVVERAS